MQDLINPGLFFFHGHIAIQPKEAEGVFNGLPRVHLAKGINHFVVRGVGPCKAECNLVHVRVCPSGQPGAYCCLNDIISRSIDQVAINKGK